MPGAYADMLLVDGDPTQSLQMLPEPEPEQGLRLIVQGGRVVHDRLAG